jgi:molybdopterin-binding protein
VEKQCHLELRNIVHRYDTKTVVSIDNLQIENGEIYSLVGPNGSGKTTLLHIMSLIMPPIQGELLYNGKPVPHDESGRIHTRRRMTVVTQSPFMFSTTVKANIEYGLKAHGIAKAEREKRVNDVLELTGLTDFAHRKARQLSGGETQLVAMARGIVLNPSILFLDEITANLDVKHIQRLESIIKDINQDRGTTIVMTTHVLSQAYALADKVLSLFDGRIVQSGMYNLFKGAFTHEGQEVLFDTGRLRIHVARENTARNRGHISINPEDIIVSMKQLHSSARNVFSGKITKIIEQGGCVHLEVDAGEAFRVQITGSSFHEMGLTLGTRVFLIFKASSVHVL